MIVAGPFVGHSAVITGGASATDVGWCGGITELIEISALAVARGLMVVPHGSSVYSYHFVITRHNSPLQSSLMMVPGADEVIPMFSPLQLDESEPLNGRMKLSDNPGFGVRLNPECPLHRPYTNEPRHCRIRSHQTASVSHSSEGQTAE